MDRRPMRYAHAEGHTEVIYTGKEEELITCGSDGDVRIWSGLEDDDPRSVCVGEWALALSVTPTHLLVSTDSHNVQKYSLPNFDKDGILARFTAPVTQLAVCKKTSKVGCCSENMEAKFCSLEDKSVSEVMSHEGPVLGISVCPTGKYSVTSSGDGMFRVWNLENYSVIKQMATMPKINSFYSAKVLGRTSFEPNSGKYFAHPNNREVIILETKSWQQKYTLSHPKIKCAISMCLFSPCGNYIAGSTVAGQIVIWDMNTASALGITEHPTSHNVCSMAWNPAADGGELAFCDVSGQLGTIVNCFGPQKAAEDDEDMDNMDLMEIIERETQDGDENELLNGIADEDEDNENAISLNKLKNETLNPDDAASVAGSRRSGRRSRSGSRSRSVSRERRRLAQPPFQPSATPVNLEHRYMCWNDVGIVRCHTSESDSSIEVEFHDSSTHHSLHLNNHLNHTMASLSKTVLVLACEAPSKLVCIALVGGSKEWSVSLPDLEEAVCLTATDNLVAVATTSRYLRLYTPLGTQLHVLSLLGEPLCLSGRDHILHMFYHATDPGVSDQNINMDTIQVNGMHPRILNSNVKVAMSAGSLLRWAGSSELGSAITLDSSGTMRLYHHSSRTWIPVCETQNHTRGVSDSYYIVSVSEESECIRAILCRGSAYPLTAPRPTVAQLPLQLPFCEMDKEKGQYEEQLRRASVIGAEETFKSKLEIILKLFALASKSEIEQRAVELMEILQDQRTLVPAARYASRVGKLHLADRLTSLSNDWDSAPPETQPMDTSTQLQVVDNVETQDLDCSLILPVKEKKDEVVPLKPAPLRTFAGRNPFRKSSSVDSNGTGNSDKPKPLSLTDRQLVTPEITPRSASNSTNEKPLPSESFMQWYARNKENLESKHGESSTAELVKIGMKVYKSLQQANGGDSGSSTPKRKLSPSKENASEQEGEKVASKQSKLSAFAFQKRTT